eukprot:scaffold109_cov252-Pinguiococcus_pyrenoidosus.AAC.70
MVYYNNAISAPMMLALAYLKVRIGRSRMNDLMGDCTEFGESLRKSHLCSTQGEFAGLAAGGASLWSPAFTATNVYAGTVGFLLNLAALWCVGTTSATTYAIIGSFNKVRRMRSPFEGLGRTGLIDALSSQRCPQQFLATCCLRRPSRERIWSTWPWP